VKVCRFLSNFLQKKKVIFFVPRAKVKQNKKLEKSAFFINFPIRLWGGGYYETPCNNKDSKEKNKVCRVIWQKYLLKVKFFCVVPNYKILNFCNLVLVKKIKNTKKNIEVIFPIVWNDGAKGDSRICDLIGNVIIVPQSVQKIYTF
jgi:hypothetical protein